MQDEHSRFAQGSLTNSNAVMDKPINRMKPEQRQPEQQQQQQQKK